MPTRQQKVLTDAGFEVSTATVDVSTRESVHALVQTATDVALDLNRDWKEPGGLDRNSAFMVRCRLRPTRREPALEHHSGVHRRVLELLLPKAIWGAAMGARPLRAFSSSRLPERIELS